MSLSLQPEQQPNQSTDASRLLGDLVFSSWTLTQNEPVSMAAKKPGSRKKTGKKSGKKSGKKTAKRPTSKKPCPRSRKPKTCPASHKPRCRSKRPRICPTTPSPCNGYEK